MANTFITPSIVGKEALMILENNLVAAQLFHRGHTEEFTGAKVGDTISIRKPASFTAQEFTTTTTTQDATESSLSLVLEKHFDVTFAVTSKQWTLDLEDFSSQLLRPALVAIAQALDNYILGKTIYLTNYVGTVSDPPDSLDDIAAIDEALNNQKVPLDSRFAIVNPAAKRDMFGITSFAEADKRGDGGQALRRASMGEFMGLDWFMSQNIPSHDTDAPSGWLANGAGAVGDTSLAIDTGSNDPKAGDVFTIAGDSTEQVVTSYSGGTVNFLPGLTAATADNAALTFPLGDHVANFAGHRNAITHAIVPLQLPQGAARAEYIGDRGLGIRVVFDYDSSTKTDTISLDLLVGAKVQDEELGLRVLG